jgi:hypothetical protein
MRVFIISSSGVRFTIFTVAKKPSGKKPSQISLAFASSITVYALSVTSKNSAEEFRFESVIPHKMAFFNPSKERIFSKNSLSLFAI